MKDLDIEIKKIGDIVNKTKNVNIRIDLLQSEGYNVKRCYVKTYNGLLGVSEFKKKGVIRIIIGRPKEHFYKEVFAVEFPMS